MHAEVPNPPKYQYMILSFSTMAGIGGIIPSAQCLCGPKGPDENVSACIPALQGGIPFFVIGAKVHGAIAILWRGGAR